MSTLNPDEVNALMSAIKDGRVAAESSPGTKANVAAYDLTSQDRVIRGQMPTLDAINEQVASSLGIGWAGRTRLNMRISSSPATLLKFLDFSSMLAPPATVAIVALGQGAGQALVVLEPGLSDALLAAALGDRKARSDEPPEEARRELTSVERQVLKRLLSLLTEAMRTAWAPVFPFQPELTRFEPDPRLAAIAPPNDAAILSTFEVTGALSGRLHLTIPYAAVEPVKKQLTSPPRAVSNADSRFARALAAELQEVHVQLRVALGSTSVKVERMLELEVGDILTLSTSEGAPLPVLVEGREKLWGRPTVHGGALALAVDQAVGDAPPRPGSKLKALALNPESTSS